MSTNTAALVMARWLQNYNPRASELLAANLAATATERRAPPVPADAPPGDRCRPPETFAGLPASALAPKRHQEVCLVPQEDGTPLAALRFLPWQRVWKAHRMAPHRAPTGISIVAHGFGTGLCTYGRACVDVLDPRFGALQDITVLATAVVDSAEQACAVAPALDCAIPPELGDMGALVTLQLHGARLLGRVPSELGRLSRVATLDLCGNHLTGPIPTELGGLHALCTLSLGDNGLTGPVPTELGGLGRLEVLCLDHNRLTGPAPTELGALRALEILGLYGNCLTGPVPTELGGLARLAELNLGANRLAGPIPTELGGLAGLETLELQGNLLTGRVPSELGALHALELLNLSGNALAAPLPTELQRLGRLLSFLPPTGLRVPGAPSP